MYGNDRYLEHAEAAEEAERERAISAIRGQMVLKGDEYCQDCGEPIDVARRMALPSATRCIACQTDYEKAGRG